MDATPITKEDTAIWEIKHGIELLKLARDHFTSAGAHKSADAVRKAISSADGARRFAEKKAHEDQPERSEKS